MIELEENLRFLNELKIKLNQIGDSIKIEFLKNELKNLEKESLQDNLWEDQKKSNMIFSKIKVLNQKINLFENIRSELNNLYEMNELLQLIHYFLESMILIMQLLLFIQVLEEQNHKTGYKCYIECMENGHQQMDLH